MQTQTYGTKNKIYRKVRQLINSKQEKYLNWFAYVQTLEVY